MTCVECGSVADHGGLWEGRYCSPCGESLTRAELPLSVPRRRIARPTAADMALMRGLGRAIAEGRKACGFNHVDLACASGLTLSRTNDVIRGLVPLTAVPLGHIARALGTSQEALLRRARQLQGEQ